MKDMNEVIDALYGVLSYLKNTTGFDKESNLIEQARAMLMQKEDLKQFRECLECPKIEACEAEDECPPDEGADEAGQDESSFEIFPRKDFPDASDQEPCATCHGQCDNGFPCHKYDGCEA